MRTRADKALLSQAHLLDAPNYRHSIQDVIGDLWPCWANLREWKAFWNHEGSGLRRVAVAICT